MSDLNANPFYTDLGVVDPETVAELAPHRKFIPDDVFKEILQWIPVPTADFVLTRFVGEQKEFLLAYRAEEPFQNTWFVPGGRINWSEAPFDACKRQAMRELGVDASWARFVDILNVINPKSDTRPLWHSIWHLYEVPVDKDIEIEPNRENLKVQWFSRIDPTFPDPVRAALKRLGFQ